MVIDVIRKTLITHYKNTMEDFEQWHKPNVANYRLFYRTSYEREGKNFNCSHFWKCFWDFGFYLLLDLSHHETKTKWFDLVSLISNSVIALPTGLTRLYVADGLGSQSMKLFNWAFLKLSLGLLEGKCGNLIQAWVCLDEKDTSEHHRDICNFSSLY